MVYSKDKPTENKNSNYLAQKPHFMIRNTYFLAKKATIDF